MHATGTKTRPTSKVARWFVWVGVSLVVAGICWAVGNHVWYGTRTWRPVDQPVSLAVGHIETSEFAVNVDSEFAVELAVDGSVPRDLMVNVLGIGDRLLPKREAQAGFRLAWIVESGGKTVVSGISDGRNQGYWGITAERRLGSFRAEKRIPYKVKIDVIEDGSKLAPYHPRLQVRVDLFAAEGYVLAKGIMQAIGAAVAALGLLLLTAAALLHWSTRKQT